VYLVGAGPGDPGLITVRGAELLRRADLVLYDGLANPLLLRHTSATCERTCRSPHPEDRGLGQAEINRRLIEAARAGRTVVRLKGGDPFIFGRGGEEAQALADARIPFEVVPGITAATAAATYAGISLTHRDLSSAVAFVTGHEDPTKGETSIDYDVLAGFDGTLVFYMGLHRLPQIVESLLLHGKPAETPACVISRATLPAQRTVAAPLSELVEAVHAAELRPPSLIVIGECARQRQEIAWFEQRPLFGRRIGITRPDGQVDREITRALELGAQPVLLPVIGIRPVDDWSPVDAALAGLGTCDWLVFTSANGVAALLGRLWETGGDLRKLAGLRVAAIGPGTAEALAAWHVRADLVPSEFRAEALAAALGPHVRGRRVLWARASRGRDVLPAELAAAGATVEQLAVYQNVDLPALPNDEHAQIERGEVEWIGLSSPSIARGLARLLSPTAKAQLGRLVRLASISPVTSAAARAAGLPIAAEARVYTWEGLFEAIVEAEAGVSGGNIRGQPGD
jgi:uroporphyrinogen III methyltransferase/synthase